MMLPQVSCNVHIVSRVVALDVLGVISDCQVGVIVRVAHSCDEVTLWQGLDLSQRVTFQLVDMNLVVLEDGEESLRFKFS